MVWSLIGLISTVAVIVTVLVVHELKMVYCETCGVRMLKDKAKKVSFLICRSYSGYGGVGYYCQAHAPKYDRATNHAYYKEMRVDLNGEPIGYVKPEPIVFPCDITIATWDTSQEVCGAVEGKYKKMPKGKGK